MNNLADMVLESWEFLLFTPEDDLDPDTAAKAEETLVDVVENTFTDAESQALQEAAQRRLQGTAINPEDESQDRRARFLTFIATGRVGDLWML